MLPEMVQVKRLHIQLVEGHLKAIEKLKMANLNFITWSQVIQ